MELVWRIDPRAGSLRRSSGQHPAASGSHPLGLGVRYLNAPSGHCPFLAPRALAFLRGSRRGRGLAVLALLCAQGLLEATC